MNKEVSDRIFKIIDSNSRISTYTITGYRLLETRLVLHFHDCEEVYHFTERSNGEVELTKFYTKDHNDEEYLTQVVHFKELHEKCKPEEQIES